MASLLNMISDTYALRTPLLPACTPSWRSRFSFRQHRSVAPKPKHHLIITGTGRAGTTLLVQLFTELGLDTGFTNITDDIAPYARAGMEFPHFHPNAPYILKAPLFCDVLDDWIVAKGVVVDHVIVPTRDIRAAAESRRYVMNTTPPSVIVNGIVHGGLWNTADPDKQEEALRNSLHNLDLAIAKHRIPASRPQFPRLAHDPEYLYQEIGAERLGFTYTHFLETYRRVVNTSLIHEF